MSWFDTAGFTNFAKTALKEAQKTIDKALDIQEDGSDDQDEIEKTLDSPPPKSDFFSSWGLTMSGDIDVNPQNIEQTIITESPSKSQTIWGSIAGSLFESPKSESDPHTSELGQVYDHSNLIDHESTDKEEYVLRPECQTEEKYIIEQSLNRLSIVSSENGNNSSESVEVLGSHKTTPDSEMTQTLSCSSSVGQRLTSDSVEIMPESLISQTSIGFIERDSRNSEENLSSATSVDVEVSNSNPVAESTDLQALTNYSVGLVIDDDEDTISYNSVSECTAPTILDTDETPPSYQPKRVDSLKFKKSERSFGRALEKSGELYASSDGSDKTLVIDENRENFVEIEERNPSEGQVQQNDVDKHSDSSSFCNLTNLGDLCASTSDQNSISGFVSLTNDGKTALCDSMSSNKEESSRDRGSPLSSESGLVKIGSDRTSGHTSGDEVETATSSDIEVIPSPTSDPLYRQTHKKNKTERCTSPNLVDFVLERSLVTKIRGHNRELSEASNMSNTSEDSASESEKMLRRLYEMTEILQARELKLLELSRSNAELTENNYELRAKLESLTSKNESSDIADDYNIRLGELEEKIQQALSEKDAYKKQVEESKCDRSLQKAITELNASIIEKDDQIKQMQEEGEKWSEQQLAQSNIIKKLRVKDNENDLAIKSLREKYATASYELDQLKHVLSTKEEKEASQNETIYKLTSSHKKLENGIAQLKSTLDDTKHKWSTCKIALDVARKELTEMERDNTVFKKKRSALSALEQEKERLEAENDHLKKELDALRAKFIQEEHRWARREANLRNELAEARAICNVAEQPNEHASALVQQLHALQYSAIERDKAHRAQSEKLTKALHEAQKKLVQVVENETSLRDEINNLRSELDGCESRKVIMRVEFNELKAENHKLATEKSALEDDLERILTQMDESKAQTQVVVSDLEAKIKALNVKLKMESANLEAERKRNNILQEKLTASSTRSQGHSPPLSLGTSEVMSLAWQQDSAESLENLGSTSQAWNTFNQHSGNSVAALDSLQSLVTRREADIRVANARIEALSRQKQALTSELAEATHQLSQLQSVKEQYDALLVLYGERAEQVAELSLDLQDVKDLYKAQFDEIISLKGQLADKA